MLVEVGKVDLGVGSIGGTQSLEVLVVPAMLMTRLLLPVFVLGHSEEVTLALGLLHIALPDLDNGRDELHEEAGKLEQTWELNLQEVDEQSLDVRAVMILISHDHEMSVTQSLGVCVVLLVLQTHEFLDVLDFGVL